MESLKRWDFSQMLDMSKKLFAKIHKRKHSTHHNHEIHFMAREIEDWLPKGIKSLQDGNYSPRHLKRYYFSDEMVDQLHISECDSCGHTILLQIHPASQINR